MCSHDLLQKEGNLVPSVGCQNLQQHTQSMAYMNIQQQNPSIARPMWAWPWSIPGPSRLIRSDQIILHFFQPHQADQMLISSLYKCATDYTR